MKKFLSLTGIMLLMLSGCTTPSTNQTSNRYQPGTQPTINPVTPPTSSPPSNIQGTQTQNQQQNSGSYITPATPNATKPTTSQQTYKNTTYNFSFLYPNGFSSVPVTYANLGTQIVQVQLDSAAYPKTNFVDAAFTVSTATANSEKNCLSMNQPEGSNGFKTSKTINGVKFYQTNGQGAGAGNFYETRTYRTFRSPNKCFELNTTIHTANIANFKPGTVTEVDKKPIWDKLESIVSTFKFNA